MKGLKLIESSLAAPVSLRIASSHSVLCDFADLDWVLHSEDEIDLLALVLALLSGTLGLLCLAVESKDGLHELGLSSSGTVLEVSLTSSLDNKSGWIVTRIDAIRISIGRHGDSFLSHEIGALSTEAIRHLLLSGLSVWVLLLLHLLRGILLLCVISTAEQILLHLLRLGGGGLLCSGLGIGVVSSRLLLLSWCLSLRRSRGIYTAKVSRSLSSMFKSRTTIVLTFSLIFVISVVKECVVRHCVK